MKILIDQNLTEYLRDLLPGHEVRHAFELGWARLSNGDLLNAAEQAGFEAMITADRNIRYQQNLTGRKIALVVLSTNRWPTIQTFGARILQALETVTEGGYQEVTFPRPRLRRRPPPAPKL